MYQTNTELYLHLAVNERIRELRPRKKAYDPFSDQQDVFGRVLNELLASWTQWPAKAQSLLNCRNWAGNRLVNADGTIRPPRITLYTEITVKDNLVLDWRPGSGENDYLREQLHRVIGNNQIEHSDFIRWSDDRPIGGEPDNRIIMIREAAHLGYPPFASACMPSCKHLAKAVVEHFSEVIEILRSIFATEVATVPVLDDSNPAGYIRIADPTEHAKELWLKKEFPGQIGIDADSLLKIYAGSGYSYPRTSKLVREQGGRASAQKVQNLIEGLYHDFPAKYSEHCDRIPPNAELPQRGGLLGFDRNHKKDHH